jgi:digeranylgeranylglycerophospholipid reductase
MYDVIVVGGNLSGTAAAIKASEKGLKVALVEKNKEPFNPAHCGEMLFDIESKPLNLDKIGCQKNQINKIIMKIPPKSYIFKFKKHKIIIFNRNFVEKKLLEKTGKNGTDLFLGVKMIDYKQPNEIVLENNEIIKGKVIIDASGILCQVGKKIGINTKIDKRDIGVCIQGRVKSDFDAETINIWFHKPYAPFGYAYLFPLNNNIANIGLGIPGGQKFDYNKTLLEYVKKVTNNNYEITSSFISYVPLAKPIRELVKDNVIITGDAARLTHPISGGGIKNAIFSGSLAGIISSKYILGEIASLKPYHDLLQKKISRLTNEYNLKRKAIKNDDSYLIKFRLMIFIAYFINRFFPNLFDKSLSNLSKHEKLVLKSLKDSFSIL